MTAQGNFSSTYNTMWERSMTQNLYNIRLLWGESVYFFHFHFFRSTSSSLFFFYSFSSRCVCVSFQSNKYSICIDNPLKIDRSVIFVHTHTNYIYLWLSFTPGTPPKRNHFTRVVWHLTYSGFFYMTSHFFVRSLYLSHWMWSFLFLSEYYENLYYPQYECNVPLLEQAAITATSSLRERGPENARLNGKNMNNWIRTNGIES